MGRVSQFTVTRYGVALLATSVAGLLTLLCGWLIQPVPLLLFLTAVVISARWGGLGPGLLATAIAALLGDLMMGPTSGPPTVEYQDRLVRLGLFTLLSLLISWSGEVLRQAQLRLRDSEQRFQSFMDHCPASAFIKDPEGRYLYLNHPFSAPFQLATRDWKGKTDAELFLPQEAEVYRENDRVVLANGLAQQVLEPMTQGDQTTYWLALKFPLQDRAGRRLVAGMAVEVTERLRLEQELQQRVEELAQADRRKDEFLAMLAHELRNPLAAISNAVHILQETAGTHPQSSHLRSLVARQTAHLTRLVDDLLDVGRITQGKVSLELQDTDLTQVVRSAVESAQPLIQSRGHVLSVQFHADPICMRLDPDRLEQVVANLLTNAARYTEPGGRIWLATEEEGSDVLLKVRDTGIGIAPEVREQIFEPFRQAELGEGHSAEGMGIGLALARNLVLLHGGTLQAESAGPGCGSEFIVRIPAVQPAGFGSRSAPPGSEAVQCQRVLVVDDNEHAAETLTELLELWGYEVQAAVDGQRALELAAGWRPHIVILDLWMPGMDGYEVAQRLHALGLQPRPRLVALTGCGYRFAARSRASGFDAYLVKPVDLEKLRALLGQGSGDAESEKEPTQNPSALTGHPAGHRTE